MRILAETGIFFLALQGDALFQVSLERGYLSRIGSVGPHGSAASVMRLIEKGSELHDPEGNRYRFPERAAA